MPVPRISDASAPWPPASLRMADAAAYCGIKLRTWEGKYKLWGVPHYKIGRTVVFRPEELDQWMAGRKQEITSRR